MTFLAEWQRSRAVSKLRKQLREQDKWIIDLEDQRISAEQGLVRAKRRKAQLEARIGLLVPPGEICYRDFPA